MAFAHRNDLAKRLRALHVPGNPIILTNVYDGATAKIVCSHPSTKALATASFAIAEAAGVTDAQLTLEDNLLAIRRIATVADNSNLPLTADLQDGYADIAANITQVIAAGAVGANIEDEDHEKIELRTFDDAVNRIRLAVAAARDAGVPDFCVNARTDALAYGLPVEEAIRRGKAFLEAGARTVFVWGGPKGRGLRDHEVERLVGEFGGMINVKMNLQLGFLNASEIARLGVARISLGPDLFRRSVRAFGEGLEEILGSR